jgi:type IX secretion system PorP/SprF family membrane protein
MKTTIYGFNCFQLLQRDKLSYIFALKLFLVSAILVTTQCAHGQQTPYLNHYYHNSYILNPATAGDDDQVRAMLIYRQQWAGVAGAPQTHLFSINGATRNKKVGLGLNMTNDVTNIINRFSSVFSTSYKVAIGESHDLSFGMSAGLLRYRLDFDKVRADLTDPGLFLNAQSASRIDGNAGVSYRFKKLKIGALSEQLFNRTFSFSSDTDGRHVRLSLVRHYALSIEYKISLNSNFSLQPLLLMRSAQGLSTHVDVNATFYFQNIAWLNVQYRKKISASFSIGGAITESLSLGYCYELPGNGIGSVSSGSHEVMLELKLHNSKSVSNNGLRERNRKRSEPVVDVGTSEQLDELHQKNELLNKALLDQKNAIEKQLNEIESLRKLITEVEDELHTTVTQIKVDLATEKNFDKNFEYVVVVGAAKTISQAKKIQRILLKERALETFIKEKHLNSWFFICTDVVQTNSEARERIKLLEEKNILPVVVGAPWIYKSPKMQ